MPHSFRELRSMSGDDFIKSIDHQFSNPLPSQLDVLLGQIYRDEWIRREQDKVTKAILRLTRVIAFLTLVMLFGLGVQIYIAWK